PIKAIGFETRPSLPSRERKANNTITINRGVAPPPSPTGDLVPSAGRRGYFLLNFENKFRWPVVKSTTVFVFSPPGVKQVNFSLCTRQTDVKKPPRFSFRVFGSQCKIGQPTLFQSNHDYRCELQSLCAMKRDQIEMSRGSQSPRKASDSYPVEVRAFTTCGAEFF